MVLAAFASFATFFRDCNLTVVGVLTRLPPRVHASRRIDKESSRKDRNARKSPISIGVTVFAAFYLSTVMSQTQNGGPLHRARSELRIKRGLGGVGRTPRCGFGSPATTASHSATCAAAAAIPFGSLDFGPFGHIGSIPCLRSVPLLKLRA
jgi:hypothetical protein